jgi:hypothetical protein
MTGRRAAERCEEAHVHRPTPADPARIRPRKVPIGMAQTSTVLHSGGCLDVLDVRCGCASGHRDVEETAGFELVVPLAGAFVRRSAHSEALVDSGFAGEVLGLAPSELRAGRARPAGWAGLAG